MIGSYLTRYAARLYTGQSEALCPGEANCKDFVSALGETPEAKEKNACIDGKCPKLPTKPKEGITEKVTKLAESVIFLFQRKRAGYPKSESQMTAREFAGLMILEGIAEGYELHIKQKPAEILKAAFGVKEN